MGVESMSDGAMGPPDWISSVNTHSVSPFCRLHDAGPARALTGHTGEAGYQMLTSVFCEEYHNKCGPGVMVCKVSPMFNLEDISPGDTPHLITQDTAEHKTQREPIHSIF